MKTTSRLMALVMVFTMPVQTAWSQPDCSAVVDPDPYTNWSMLSPAEKFQNLLVMLGTTNAPEISMKDVRRDGEMQLGINLSRGRTLFLEYKIMAQREPKRAFLQKITLVKANGKSVKLSGEPVDEETLKPNPIFDKKDKDEKEDLSQDRDLVGDLKSSAFPAVIETDLLVQLLGKSLMGNKIWLNHALPEELRKVRLDKNGLMWPIINGHMRWWKNLVTKKFGSQLIGTAFQIVIIGGLAVAFSIDFKGGRTTMIRDVLQHEEATQTAPGHLDSLLEFIKGSKDIIASDRQGLLNRLENGARLPVPGTLTFSDLEIVEGSSPGGVWIHDRATDTLYLGQAVVRRPSEDRAGSMSFENLVEIPKGMKTYAYVSGLFPGKPVTP